MSVVTAVGQELKLSEGAVISIASHAGLSVKQEHIDDFAILLGSLDQHVEKVLAEKDGTLKPDLELYPRTDIHIPEETEKGGWATRVTAKCTKPKSELLKGKAIALKDNIALAGVRCTNGTNAVQWTPKIDATIATRIMDAGGVITGKAACENACMEGVSDTSCTGKVHNPYADNYSAGGSSSGSGRLVAIGSVDMAIGCDQGGSIRIPASMCGIVGHKPTWGLVPYTGILTGEATIDHAGPMTKTVRDAALLLEVIAGPDGIDDRQPPYLPPGTLSFTSQLDQFLSPAREMRPLTGTKVGILDEGFNIAGIDANVKALCTSAATKFSDLGATVSTVTIPSHLTASIWWMLSVPIAGVRQAYFNDIHGRKQFFLTDRSTTEGGTPKLTQTQFDALGPGAQNAYLRHFYLYEKYGLQLHAKCTNLLRKLSADYDQALSSVDVLVMPTLPSPPCRLFDDPAAHGPLERLSRNIGLVGNTAPFDSTGHPALSIPVGFVPAHEDKDVKLPVGLMVVGRKFHDIDCLKVGAAWERAYDWASSQCENTMSITPTEADESD